MCEFNFSLNTQKPNGPRAVLGSQRPRTREDAQIRPTLHSKSAALRAEDGSRSGGGVSTWRIFPTIRRALAMAMYFACISSLSAQPLAFNTLVGHAGNGSADGAGNAAGFNTPSGIAADSAGNLYVADTANHTIRKITSAGFTSTLAGFSGANGTADGTNTDARFNLPYGLAVDSSGVVYVADAGNHTIRKITPGGVVTTFAGSAGVSGNGNGSGTNAQFFQPQGVAVDTAGNVFVADTLNHVIRKITAAGAVSTFAGLPGAPGTNDASGTSARFYQPQAVALDNAGNVYVADTANHTVRKITSSGLVTTLAGSALTFGSADAAGTSAFFYQPQGIAVDGAGFIYVADYWNQIIRRISPAGVVATIAGSVTNSGSIDGTNASARFWGPTGVTVTGTNNPMVYLADSANGTIRKISLSGANWVVTTIAGSASAGSADGTQLSAQFYWPAGVAVDSAANVFVADTRNDVIRKITPAGAAITLAGSPGNPGSADGAGTSARFYGPQGVVADTSGFLYVADTGNHAIRSITMAGVVSTIAGSPGNSGSSDGLGANAQFFGPQAIAADMSGNLYVADTWNHTIRKVTSAGAVTTLAGSAGNYGSADGTNSRARFNYPGGIAVDAGGNVFVSDSFNHLIRKITPAGLVTTLVGMAGVWGKTDGTNNSARFFEPKGIVVDASANIYVADSGNHALRKVAPSGTNWVVSTVAGLPGVSGSVNGIGAGARFNYFAGLAMDNAGYLYTADAGNNTIRVDRIVPPLLQFSRAASQASLFWPAASDNFILESTSSLFPGSVWSAVTNTPSISAGIMVLNPSLTAPASFYRLRKP